MAHIISLTSVKGGAGKSTLGTALASEWHRRARRVAVIDIDDVQRSAVDWVKAGKAAGSAMPPVVQMDDDIQTRLHRFARDYEIVIVDCPGRVIERVSWVLGESALALMPCGPAPMDLWAMAPTLKHMRKVMASSPELLARILIAKKPPNTVLGRTARKAFDETKFDLLDTELEAYVDYAYATGLGLGPTTYAPSSDAARQVQQLINELDRLLHSITPHQPKPKRKRSVAA